MWCGLCAAQQDLHNIATEYRHRFGFPPNPRQLIGLVHGGPEVLAHPRRQPAWLEHYSNSVSRHCASSPAGGQRTASAVVAGEEPQSQKRVEVGTQDGDGSSAIVDVQSMRNVQCKINAAVAEDNMSGAEELKQVKLRLAQRVRDSKNALCASCGLEKP